jgi:hypothetical protein
MVGGDAIHILGRSGYAAKDIAASHYHTELHAGASYGGYFSSQLPHTDGINSERS